jgi:transketolase
MELKFRFDEKTAMCFHSPNTNGPRPRRNEEMSMPDHAAASTGATRDVADAQRGSAPDKASLRLMANAIRALSIDAIEHAASGHPGLPLGMADVAAVLFGRFIKVDSQQPHWPDRDRFVLSAGHGSMLLYALLHLMGHADMSIEDIKDFRKLGARAAGHPEYGHATGIETTTGPLGQGLATAIGMAMAERMQAAHYGAELVDHRTWVIASDGDLMEGVSQEAISLAGRLGLGRLIVLFDDNDISIDGHISLVDATDQIARFDASAWHTQRVDGHDPEAVARAIEAALADPRPSLIACRTIIGYGAPTKQGTPGAHSSPLGTKEVEGVRSNIGWSAAPFEIPADACAAWNAAAARARGPHAAWQARLDAAGPETRDAFLSAARNERPAGLDAAIASAKQSFLANPKTLAVRKASEAVLEFLVPAIPEIVTGSADLTSANFTKIPGFEPISQSDFSGRYVYWGIREHAMAAAMNGMVLHGGMIPASGTFLAFSDYCRPALRLAALMGVGSIHVMTHDSIGLGEDGPTHQPVEHLAALRAIPNLLLLRPADGIEAAECWQIAIEERRRPSVMALCRQEVPPVRHDGGTENRSARGAYELAAAEGETQATIFATGSEVHIAMAARHLLKAEGVQARVVSIPSFELFAEQPQEYQDAVIGSAPVKVAVEAAIRQGWDAIIGREGGFVGMHGFGASGKPADLYAHFGITPEAVRDAVRQKLSARA